MKNIFCIAALCLSALFISCKKTTEPTSIIITGLDSVDKWILTETLMDPGDGSGKWKPANKQNYYFIKFNADSSITTNTLGRFYGMTRYKAITDSSLLFFYANGNAVTLFYKINGSVLTITGGCYEACGSKFKAIL